MSSQNYLTAESECACNGCQQVVVDWRLKWLLIKKNEHL